MPSRSISRGRPFGGPISKARCNVSRLFGIFKIGSSGAKVPLGPLWETAASPRVRASLETLKSRRGRLVESPMLCWESGGFVFHLDEFEGLISAMQKTIILLLC